MVLLRGRAFYPLTPSATSRALRPHRLAGSGEPAAFARDQAARGEAPVFIAGRDAQELSCRAVEPDIGTADGRRARLEDLPIECPARLTGVEVDARPAFDPPIQRQQPAAERRAIAHARLQLLDRNHGLAFERLDPQSPQAIDIAAGAERGRDILPERANVGSLRAGDAQGEVVFA